MRSYESATVGMLEHSAEKVSTDIDNDMSSMISLLFQLKMAFSSMQHGGYSVGEVWEMQEFMKVCRTISDLPISEIAYLDADQGFLTTDSSSHGLPGYYKRFESFAGISFTEFFSNTTNENKLEMFFCFMPSVAQEDAVNFAICMLVDHYSEYPPMLMLHIKSDDYFERTAMGHRAENQDISIHWNGTELYSSDNEGSAPIFLLEKAVPNTGIVVAASIDRASYYRQFYSEIFIYYIILMECVLAGLALVLILSNTSYRPIKKLVSGMSAALLEKPGRAELTEDVEKTMDELELAYRTFQQLARKTAESESVLLQLSEQLERIMVQRLLLGDTRCLIDVKPAPDSLAELLSAPCYFGICMNTSSQEAAKLPGLLKKEFGILGINRAKYSRLSCIVPLESDDLQPQRVGEIDAFIASCGIKAGCGIGVGSQVVSPDQIYRSNLEALSALSECGDKGGIIFFTEHKRQKYPDRVINKACEALSAKKLKDFTAAMNNFSDEIMTPRSNIGTARLAAYALLSNLAGKIQSSSADLSGIYSFLMLVMESETLPDIGFALDEAQDFIIHDIKWFKPTDAGMTDKAWVRDVQRFVGVHYLDQNFTVGLLAECFNMSMSSFSQRFKRCTGENISNYIFMMRMETAKELLVQTELSIGEISERVRFASASNFIKRFKQFAGVSPGTFRSHYTKKDNG